jgi:hypothetical protein
MLTKRLFIYLLLASSLLCNGWIWFISPNPPRLDKVVLKYPIGDQEVIYGIRTDGGGATVGFSYRYYLRNGGSSNDDEILSSLVNASPFLITKDPKIRIESRGAELKLWVAGRIDRFHSQVIVRRSSDDYHVMNISLTSISGELGSMQ